MMYFHFGNNSISCKRNLLFISSYKMVTFLKGIVLLQSIIGFAVVWAGSPSAGMPRGYCDISQDEVITWHLDIASRTYRGIGLVNNTIIGEVIALKNNTDTTIANITMNITDNEQSNEENGNRKSFRRLLTDYNLFSFFNFRENHDNIRQRSLSHVKEGMMQSISGRNYRSEPAFLTYDEAIEETTQHHHRRLQLIDETDLLPETFDVKRCGCRALIDYSTAFYCPAKYEYCYIPRNPRGKLFTEVGYNGTSITSRKNSTKLTNARINGGVCVVLLHGQYDSLYVFETKILSLTFFNKIS